MTSLLREELAVRIGRQRLIVLGDLMLDEYILGGCSRVSPEAPVPVVQFGHTRAVPGGAANTASNAASLGCSVTLIGQVGDDEAGRTLVQAAKAGGIHLVPIYDSSPTTRKVRVIAQQQHLLRLDYDREYKSSATSEAETLRAFERALPDCDVVILSDYAKGFLTESLCQRIIAAAHEQRTKVVVDPKPHHRAFYVGCDYITPNWKESQELLGTGDRPFREDQVLPTAKQLSERLHCNVVLTLGPHGIAFFGRNNGEHFVDPATAREVFDVSGAGDTVVAVLAAGLAAGCDHPEAVRLANRAAGIVVGKQGTATVTSEELFADDEPQHRLVPRERLAALSDSLKRLGKVVVTINGAFDLLHPGHLKILQIAKEQGDVLIVGLNSDASVRGYKGPTRPIVGEADRAAMLLALRSVDYVHIFDEAVPNAFLEQVRPNIHVNGAEYGAHCVEAETVLKGGGRLHLVERTDSRATSALIERIVESRTQTHS